MFAPSVSAPSIGSSSYSRKSSYAELFTRQQVQAKGGDRVELSKTAIEKHDLMRLLDTFSSIYSSEGNSKYKTLGEVGQDLQEDLAGLSGMFGEFFPLAGIDTSTPITFQPDGKGHVLAVGEHKDGQAANNLFAGNPTMVSRFMVSAARASLVQLAEDNQEFKQDYEQDPPAAIRKHVDSLKEYLLGFQLTTGGDDLSYKFEGKENAQAA